MTTIALEDLATVFVSEFVKQNSHMLDHTVRLGISQNGRRWWTSSFMKMNYAQRRKLVEQTLAKMERDIKNG